MRVCLHTRVRGCACLRRPGRRVPAHTAALSAREVHNKKKMTPEQQRSLNLVSTPCFKLISNLEAFSSHAVPLEPAPPPPENSGDAPVKQHARSGDALENKKLEPFGFAYPIRGHGAGTERGKCLRDLFWSHLA